jgi:two-component system, LuxR family, response regulator FixJ
MTTDGVVHLIDDDEAVRRSLAFLLTSSGFAVRLYESASAFLEMLDGVQPGCIVTDVRMPGISGLDLQRQLKALHIVLPVIVMTGHGDISLAVEAMKSGAIDFIEKPFSDETLISSIRVAIDRHARDAIQHRELAAITAKLRMLTAREAEILEGLVAGLPNKTIAYDLNISARTVEVHRANVMTKMSAGSLAELVRMVLLSRSGAGGS